MKCSKNIMFFSILAIVFSSFIAGCTPPGKIGEMSKFDIATASREDIAKALNKDGKVTISGGILFETDSARLNDNAEDIVSRVADVMKENPDLKIAVVGNTDNTGDFNYNIRLSERRARAFMDALINDGIKSNRLAAVGVGPINPVATNDTTDGRAQNRRVELVLIR